MTDKEIIQALECCDDFGWCGQCSLQGVIDCKTVLTDNALDLINRQQAEIEWKTTYMHSLQVSMEEIKPQIKAETIKDLEVKIYEKLHEAEMHGNFEPTLTREMLDSIFKEMVGDDK